jgi:hypothetical protein
MRIVAPCSCIVAIGVWLGMGSRPATPATPQVRALPGPMDVVYAAPGDLNYVYGPTGADLSRLTANAVTATITVTYSGFSAQAQAAFQAAVDIWANTISSPAPIRVNANFVPLGTGILGSAGPSRICSVGAGVANTGYAAALADKLNGSAFCAALSPPISSEINATFNSSFADWEFGTTGVGVAGKYNFLTVVLHELGHGLGFFGSMTASSSSGTFLGSFGRNFGGPVFPDIYDRFARTGGGAALIGFANPSAALGAQLVSNDTFFNGANTGTAKLETHNFTTAYGRSSDNGWLQGSSYSHVDDVLYTGTPNGLMTWQLNSNEVYTDPGPIMRGMFRDEGWTITAASCTFSLNASGTSASAAATVGAVTVTTQPSCAWTAVSNLTSMVTITSGASGTGPGPVNFSISANPSTSQRVGTLTIAGLTFTITQAGRLPTIVPSDIDGDGLGDLVVWRPGSGTWFSLTSTSGYNYASSRAQQWGNQSAGDVPLLGDIDGDGISDLVVWRTSTGTWYWLTSSSNYNPAAAVAKQWGNASLGDQPMLADMDGDRKMDLVVWRASSGTWYWLTSSSGYNYATSGTKQWGSQGSGDVPKLADIDGDGKADLIVWRAPSGTWFWLTSASGYDYAQSGVKQWGSQGAGDVPLVGDLDGDGKTELVVWRAPSGTWYWLTSASGYNYAAQAQKQWGSQGAGDMPFLPDLDGDGKVDLTVWRPSTGTWFWLTSVSGYNYPNSLSKQWGSQSEGDIPVSN